MHNNFIDDTIAVASGVAFSILGVFLKFDMNSFQAEAVKTAEVLWFGVIGGVGGYLGKKIIDQLYKKKKNGNNNQPK